MAFNGKRSYRKKRGAPKKRMYKKRGGVSNTIKRYVKRTIHSQIENKVETDQGAGDTITSYAYNTGLFVRTCIPYTKITQGVDMGRIGNEIKTRTCLFSYSIAPNAYDSVFNPVPRPQEVMVFFGKVLNKKPQEPVSTDFAKLFQNGDTSISPQSNPLDLILPINKDYFKIYKVFRHKIGYAVNVNSGANVSAASYANNDFKLNVVNKVNCTKWCPKTLKFNDTTNQPTNDGLYMFAMSINADGTASSTPTPLKMWWNNTYTYEDA